MAAHKAIHGIATEAQYHDKTPRNEAGMASPIKSTRRTPTKANIVTPTGSRNGDNKKIMTRRSKSSRKRPRTSKDDANDVYIPYEGEEEEKEVYLSDEEFSVQEDEVRATPVTPSPSKRKTKKTPSKKSSALSQQSSSSSPSSLTTIATRGLPRGSLGKCSLTGLTIRTLDGIAKPTTLVDILPRTPLPGRIMIVAPDEQEEALDMVDQVFESADQFHDLLQEQTGRDATLVTYDMEALPDPSFASFDFAHNRLSTAGLLEWQPDDNNNKKYKNGNDTSGPFVVRIQWDGGVHLSGTVTRYSKIGEHEKQKVRQDDQMLWTVLEGSEHWKKSPPLLLGAPRDLVEYKEKEGNAAAFVGESNENIFLEDANCLLPQPAKTVKRIRLPASLLQKSIRRGSGGCSSVPLLEACRELLHPSRAYPGSTLAFLKTLWECMLVDSSPFEDSSDCLGLLGILLLSLVAKADSTWLIPPELRRNAMASALRTAELKVSQPWIGFVERSEKWYELENEVVHNSGTVRRAVNLRNILRVTQSVAGGKLKWGKWNSFIGDTSAAAVVAFLNHWEWNGSHLSKAPPARSNETAVLDQWEKGTAQQLDYDSMDARLSDLDNECRLASIEPTVIPHSLVLLQGILAKPPTSWKKHSLPALSKQVRKLSSEANPRFRERIRLARLDTWGKEQSGAVAKPSATAKVDELTLLEEYKSYREFVTPTGTLSDAENEVLDCLEAIQCWQHKCLKTGFSTFARQHDPTTTEVNSQNCRIKAGSPLTPHDGRIAFLLAFASAIEVEVLGEVVSAMFCGDSSEPLLVQRIGKARTEGRDLATAGGATSGAMAVPSLGYLQRSRSDKEAKLMEAAELAVAEHWKDGKSGSLPTPPPGFQWEILGLENLSTGWDDEEPIIERTASFSCTKNGKMEWRFTIGGKAVVPFDARSVISPCALDVDDEKHKPIPLRGGSDRDRHLRTAFYLQWEDGKRAPLQHGKAILESITGLHDIAELERATNTNEGVVYDWIQLARQSLIPSRTWRDALLAIRTRESEFVFLGKGINSDGTGAPRDMTEGVLVRIFHALECLYPMVLRKEGAMKFRLRPKGASHHHLLCMLERLGRGEVDQMPLPLATISLQAGHQTKCKSKRAQLYEREQMKDTEPVRKRPRRRAAAASSQSLTSHAVKEIDFGEEVPLDTCSSLPKVTTALWRHQESSVKKIAEGVRAGKRGHADASAVGAGKTLTLLNG